MAKIQKSITIDEALSKKVEKLAQIENRSFSAMLETIVKKHLEFNE